MITEGAANLGVSVAAGLLKLAVGVDRLLAEKEAVSRELVLPMPPVSRAPTAGRMQRDLSALLLSTTPGKPGALGSRRRALARLLKRDPPPVESLAALHQELFPERWKEPDLDPDQAFFRALKEARPDFNLRDPEARRAALYLAAGPEQRAQGAPWRLALIVVDALAGFGAETTRLFLRREPLRDVVQAVLVRFARPDLKAAADVGGLLQRALAATLDGVLDARGSLRGHGPYLGLLLDALADARESPAGGDDFLTGLISGQGYPLLVQELLQRGGALLGAEGAPLLRSILGEFLLKGAALMGERPRFRGFFEAHWGDLVRGAFQSLADHGPALLPGRDALLSETLQALLATLAATPNQRLLSSGLLKDLTAAVLEAVASHPELLGPGQENPWLAELLKSLTELVSKGGVGKLFSPEGLTKLLARGLKLLAQRPELLVQRPGLLKELVGGVARRLSQKGGHPSLQGLITGAVEGSLLALARNPATLEAGLAPAVSLLAEVVGQEVAGQGLSTLDGAHLLRNLPEVLAANPRLLGAAERKLAVRFLTSVLRILREDGGDLLAGELRVAAIEALLRAFGRSGLGFVDAHGAAAVVPGARALLRAALSKARQELGRGLDLQALPALLGGLLEAWLKGDRARVDGRDPSFQQLFARLVEESSP